MNALGSLRSHRTQFLVAPLQGPRSPRRRGIVASNDGPRRRLLPYVLSVPRRVEEYFEQSKRRRVMWCVGSAASGFYAGNIISLSFGALAVNDVLAAVTTLVFYEVVSAAFYGSERPTLRAWFANYFKIGVLAAALTDALKLGA